MGITREHAEALLRKRQIAVFDVVTDETHEYVVESILYLNAIDESAPITLFINSIGGKAIAGLRIAEAISASRAPITGLVVGTADSAAFVILQACKRRTAYKHATLMFHGGKINCRINAPDFDEQLQAVRRSDREFMDKLSKRSGQPTEQLSAWADADKQFFATEALDLGFLDEVVEP